jgi:RNA polymerase sigma-70 factor (ECF subfamily)
MQTLAINTPSDEELVERAKQDRAAFGELYDRYRQRIYRFVSSRVDGQAAAEDLTEEVFFKALQHIRSYRDVGGSFSPWLYRIASNAITDHYRRSRRRPEPLEAVRDEVDPTDAVLDLVIKRERRRRAWQAIDRLPRQQRAAMILKFSADLSPDEVGRRLRKSPAAAKLLVHRAVRRLRLELVPAEAV